MIRMSNIKVKCNNCSHKFFLEFHDFHLTLRCPNCNLYGLITAFSTNFVSSPTWKSGYELSLERFMDLLRDGGESILKNFFKKYFDLSFTRRKNGDVSLKDSFNKFVSIEEIHELIQNNWLLQRWIYNIEFATLR